MSDLQRAFAKAKLSGLPPVVPRPLNDLPEDEEEEERDSFGELRTERSDDDSSSASSTSSTGTIRPSSAGKTFARPNGYNTSFWMYYIIVANSTRSASRSSGHSPLSWTSYFERDITIPHKTVVSEISHHAYLTSPIFAPGRPGPLFIAHHGAGSSALSFALMAKAIKERLPDAGILSVDARGHGSTTVTPTSSSSHDEPLDMSLESLTSDLLHVIQSTKEQMKWPSMPPLILVGHSLGGSVVTAAAARGTLGPALLAYAVLDIVENTAIEALSSMDGYLKRRPATFPSLEAAIDWHLRSHLIRNAESARISVPPLLSPTHKDTPSQKYSWRTDLAATSPFWPGWFTHLSSRFLTSRGGKLLLLAGTERLDTEMMIGQMQGKYALQIFPEAGHFLHEDCPEKTAQAVVELYKRNDRAGLVLPMKVDEMIKMGKKI